MSQKIFIVGILGSPRKDGNTHILLQEALKEVEKEGGKTKTLFLIDFNLKPCLGCYSDKPNLCNPVECTKGILDDGMKGIFDILLSSDGVIFSTPVYWFGPSGLMKNFIDRLTSLENSGKLLDGKIGGFIASGEEDGAVHAILSMLAAANEMGLIIPPYAFVYSTSRERRDFDALKDARRLGKNIMRLARIQRIRGIDWRDVD